MNFRKITRLAAGVLLVLACSSVRADDPVRIRDVVYGHKLGCALSMDVFKPAKPNGIGVIWVVSGGWVSNHESINPEFARHFTARGDTVFEVVHGSQPRFILPEILQDMYRSVRFIRAHAAEYGVDPNRLGVSGGSAGGHLSLMIGANGAPGDPNAKDPVDRESSAVQAIACFFPPTDFLNYGKENQNAMVIATLKPFWTAFGVTDATLPETRAKLGHDLSPIYTVTPKMPPTLILHGDADFLVPLQQSQRMMDKLQQVGVPHQLIIKKGQGHGWGDLPNDLETCADWFDKYLARK